MMEALYWVVASRVARWGYEDPEVIIKVGVVKTTWTTLQLQYP
jgi:hypothetical protein